MEQKSTIICFHTGKKINVTAEIGRKIKDRWINGSKIVAVDNICFSVASISYIQFPTTEDNYNIERQDNFSDIFGSSFNKNKVF